MNLYQSVFSCISIVAYGIGNDVFVYLEYNKSLSLHEIREQSKLFKRFYSNKRVEKQCVNQ